MLKCNDFASQDIHVYWIWNNVIYRHFINAILYQANDARAILWPKIFALVTTALFVHWMRAWLFFLNSVQGSANVSHIHFWFYAILHSRRFLKLLHTVYLFFKWFKPRALDRIINVWWNHRQVLVMIVTPPPPPFIFMLICDSFDLLLCIKLLFGV
jgi:hypothetical protein